MKKYLVAGATSIALLFALGTIAPASAAPATSYGFASLKDTVVDVDDIQPSAIHFSAITNGEAGAEQAENAHLKIVSSDSKPIKFVQHVALGFVGTGAALVSQFVELTKRIIN